MKTFLSHRITDVVILLLTIIGAFALVWPLYRVFLKTTIATNEGWNACFADAAMGKMPLYPSPEKLITNNYPPLSFYVVGIFGKWIGDNVFAGRLISLIAFFTIFFFIIKIVKKYSDSWLSGLVGGLFFIIIMTASFSWYIGFNDPQLLAEAIMIIGFFLFLRAVEENQGFWLPIMVMVLAGFFKHNIITFPLSIFLWLALQRRWQVFLNYSLLSFLLIGCGFFSCYCIYGKDFIYNFFTPRQWQPEKIVASLKEIQWMFLGALIWLMASWTIRRESRNQLVMIIIIISLIVGFIQRLGSGVFRNAHIDSVIASAIAVGMAFQVISARFEKKKYWYQLGLLVYLILPWLTTPLKLTFRPCFSAAYQAKIQAREDYVKKCVEKVRAISGDVFCEPYIVYRAGKTFVVDQFNLNERIKAGIFPSDIIAQKVRQGKLTVVECGGKIELE